MIALDASGHPTGRTRTLSEGRVPDADLAALVVEWPTLPNQIRAVIRVRVGTVAGTS